MEHGYAIGGLEDYEEEEIIDEWGGNDTSPTLPSSGRTLGMPLTFRHPPTSVMTSADRASAYAQHFFYDSESDTKAGTHVPVSRDIVSPMRKSPLERNKDSPRS